LAQAAANLFRIGPGNLLHFACDTMYRSSLQGSARQLPPVLFRRVIGFAALFLTVIWLQRCQRQAFSVLPEHHRNVEDALHKYWEGLNGRGIAAAEEVMIARAATCKSDPLHSAAMTTEDPMPATYGEVTPAGARRVFAALGLLDADGAHDDPYVFLDLGSGVGKLVVQAYLELPLVVRSIGVELSPTRSLHASEAWGIPEKLSH